MTFIQIIILIELVSFLYGVANMYDREELMIVSGTLLAITTFVYILHTFI